jgi:hypothetical protein
MEKVVIKMVGFADGRRSSIDGMFLKSFDHEANEGLGDGLFTPDKSEAMTFEDVGEALAFWNKIPANRPVRPDGKPNKPLTASTIAVERWADA